jgi:hypothetical protein
MHTNWRRFESPEEFGDYLKTIPSNLWSTSSEDFAGVQLPQAIDYLQKGNVHNLEAAQKIMHELNTDDLFSVNVPVLRPDVVGIIPNVAGLVAGHPQGMFARHFEELPSLNAPLTVYIETTTSAGVPTQHLINRGIATLAFVLAMETIRPVDLYTVSIGSHSRRDGIYGAVVKIASRPMDIGRAVYMLTDPSYGRRIFHSMSNEMSGTNQRCGVGPWCFGSPSSDNYVPQMRKLLDMQPEDVYLKGGYLTDKLMLTNPIQWVKDMVAKHSNQTEQ